MTNDNNNRNLQSLSTESFRQQIDMMSTQVEELWSFSSNQLLSHSLLHLVGYGFIFFSIIDAIIIVIPPNFMNPEWEMGTIGALVQRTPVPLLGIALVFYGGNNARKIGEKRVLTGLSWLSLVVGLLFFCMIPLGITNTIRLDRQNSQETITAIVRQSKNIDQLTEDLERANDPEEMQNIINRLPTQENIPKINSQEKVADIRDKMIQAVARAESQFKLQAANTKKSRRMNLLKNSVKWNLGALISGMLFVIIWKLTFWSRY